MSDMLIRDKSYDLFCAAGGPEEGPPAASCSKKPGRIPALRLLKSSCVLLDFYCQVLLSSGRSYQPFCSSEEGRAEQSAPQ